MAPGEAFFIGVCLIIASAALGFVQGAEWGTPVFNITEVVYPANPYRIQALDGVVCYISSKTLP